MSQNLKRAKMIKNFFKALGVTGGTLVILAMFLSPFLFMVFTAMKSPEQMSAIDAPIWPAKQATYTYEGNELEIYYVPMPDGSTQELAMVKPGRSESIFVDPRNPEAGEITWKGSWRTRNARGNGRPDGRISWTCGR